MPDFALTVDPIEKHCILVLKVIPFKTVVSTDQIGQVLHEIWEKLSDHQFKNTLEILTGIFSVFFLFD